MGVYIADNMICRLCNWPTVYVTCNDGMFDEEPYCQWDW